MKSFTGSEWRELTKDDELYNFVTSVGEIAVKKELWKANFRQALYDTLYQELSKYLLNKYNGGQPFRVSGE